MTQAESEERIVARVRAAVGERPVLLAGSRATGTATRESDWDVVVVLPLVLVPFALRRLARAGAELSAEVGAPVTVNPLPARLLDDASRLFVWKLRTEGRVLHAPRGFGLPPAPPPQLDDEARFSFALSGLFYLRAGSVERARLVLAQLRALQAGAYVREAPDDVSSDSEALRTQLAALARPFPHRTRARRLLRAAQYVALSAVRGRIRLAALASRRAPDELIAERVLAGDEDATLEREWECSHPLMGIV